MHHKPQSISEQKAIDWKATFSALKYVPRFFREIRQSSKLYFYTNLISILVNAFTPVMTLWVGKLLIDEIILQSRAGDPQFAKIWLYVGLELGLALLSDWIGRLITLTDGLMGDLYSNDSSVKIIRKTKELEISQLEDSEFYDKLEMARMQTNSRVGLMSNTLSQLQDLIVIGSLVAGLIYFEPILIGILILSIIPSFINEMRFSSSRYSIARSWTAERRELDYLRYIGANDTTAREVKLFGLVDFIVDRFRNLADEYYQINKTLAVRRSWFGALFNLLGVLSYYGAYVLIIYRAVSGAITIGDLTFLSGSFNRLRGNLNASFNRLTRISESALYLKDYFDFIDYEIPEPQEQPIPVPKILHRGFEFRDVHFHYPGSDHAVLQGVSFQLVAGEKMAFVGENGAGKTTLIKLLLRFYEPTQGEILLDGININRFDKEQYQEFFGVIFQDFVRYELTVKENIAVGNIDELLNMDAIREAAALSLADEVVEDLPGGYDQQLGKRFFRGVDLSGGQWQKIALARAYMKDAQVMILDEPTSALDARAEYEAFQRFINLTKGRTSIIISHRFSTVRMADRILVLQDGRILELGTHEQLLA
ncbi:MAG: ABC transporter ATP-binding protein, partial [Saprospiraceae bacterium]|nr:ABC transporter ATP-binding protein [Saprospiraceae bacterium]